LTHNHERIVCLTCQQDYQTWYRVRIDGRTFLLCPECDAVWLPGDDRHKKAVRSLDDLFPGHPNYQAWDLIEPCDPPGNA
jgi:hypothetical protein